MNQPRLQVIDQKSRDKRVVELYLTGRYTQGEVASIMQMGAPNVHRILRLANTHKPINLLSASPGRFKKMQPVTVEKSGFRIKWHPCGLPKAEWHGCYGGGCYHASLGTCEAFNKTTETHPGLLER